MLLLKTSLPALYGSDLQETTKKTLVKTFCLKSSSISPDLHLSASAKKIGEVQERKISLPVLHLGDRDRCFRRFVNVRLLRENYQTVALLSSSPKRRCSIAEYS